MASSYKQNDPSAEPVVVEGYGKTTANNRDSKQEI